MSNKKKVLHLVEAFGGGVFTFLSDFLNEMTDDYEIVVVYSMRKQTPENFKKYFNKNIKFIEIKNFTRSINPIKDLKAFFEIKKIIKEENPDIIHLHSSKAGFIGRFATNGRKKKMLYNPHGFSFLMQDSSKIKRAIYWAIEKIAAFRKCTIVGCSKGEYKEALKLSKNSICIDNGISIEKMNNITKNIHRNEINYDNLRICTVGRIGTQKNPKLFNEIAKAFPKNDFTWIGDGELKSELTSSNIYITGWKHKEEVLHILSENDIFILTSLWEGLPISLLEAMYMNKICIVNNCIGNSDVINGTNGIVCNNLEDFKTAIEDIKRQKINIENMIINAREDIENVYNVNNMVREYKKLYEEKK